jgi:hypothetical protein
LFLKGLKPSGINSCANVDSERVRIARGFCKLVTWEQHEILEELEGLDSARWEKDLRTRHWIVNVARDPCFVTRVQRPDEKG